MPDKNVGPDKQPRRSVNIHFRVTEDEASAIRQRMAEVGVYDLGAYARRMMIHGLHITVDLTDVGEMVSLLRRVGLNVNQIAKRANETRSIYAADLEDMRRAYDEIWIAARKILGGLSKIK
ncbi:MAG: MobC family plasmid mobilization relaxosome protein [Clostridiales bacterium]|nr:MobC family plasmid mobilization relaxosome protein [Clostridiales bacterium]